MMSYQYKEGLGDYLLPVCVFCLRIICDNEMEKVDKAADVEKSLYSFIFLAWYD